MDCGRTLQTLLRGRLEHRIRSWFEQTKAGGALSEIDCRIKPDLITRPGIGVYLLPKWKSIDWHDGAVPFAPDIVAEILLSKDLAVDVRRRALQYLAAGSQEVWHVDSVNNLIFVQTEGAIRLLRGDHTLESPLLPGFSVSVHTLLAQP